MFKWDSAKNEWLKTNRNISFEELIQGEILIIRENESKNHQGQLALYIKYSDYVWKIPFVIEENGDWFLKTAFQDRKENKKWRI